jgi:hypothetical protein
VVGEMRLLYHSEAFFIHHKSKKIASWFLWLATWWLFYRIGPIEKSQPW